MNITIKSAYIIIGATFMLSACTQDDISVGTTDAGERIIFRTTLPDVSSRAAEIATDFTYFHLTAFNPADPDLMAESGALSVYIDNETIVKVLGQNVITSDKCIWPAPGKDGNMSFFAYYPELPSSASLANWSSVSGGTVNIDYKISDYSIAPDIADQVDFVTAYTTGSKAENLFSGITLNFAHQLSRIEVKARGANESCNIEIAGVRIGGVGVKGTFDFSPPEGSGPWSGQEKGNVEYIYRQDDEIVTLRRKNATQSASDAPVSIMGADLDSESNCAMLLPTIDATGWNYATDRQNMDKGMYISVLMRVTDAEATQQYPYTDNKEGPDALNIPVVYLAVENNTGKVKANPGQLYKGDDGKYYTDSEKNEEYIAPDGCIVKEFGWAAVPVTGEWKSGYIYTYTLDYTYGVGVHDPSVGVDNAPKAGDPIISDKVLVSITVAGWKPGSDNGVEVPRK